jgi:Ribonuclease D
MRGGKDGKQPDSEVLKALKDLLEDEKVIKVIHDCRLDSDALFHHYGIHLNNVYDTACFHAELVGDGASLNEVLMYNGFPINRSRDKSIYKRDPNFWANRPLTQMMIDWASSDVDRLVDIVQKQLEKMDESKKNRAIEKSSEYADLARNMKVVTGLSVNNMGLFIGRGGRNIRRLEKRTGTLMYQDHGKWFVYYPDTFALTTVKYAMNN